MANATKRKKVVVVGGGTGNFTLLTGLKKHPLDLSAIVSMVDDGGSTGVLRDELGVLPPGDIRQCLVALSSSDEYMRELMGYRFTSGNLRGHSFGNLLLTALEKSTGSFDRAIEAASEILRIVGRVIPATLDSVQLVAQMKGGSVMRGQYKISHSNLRNMKNLTLEPTPRANPKAIKAINEADLIVISPGDFYSSIIPNLLIKGISRAINKSKAKKVYVCNLMTNAGQTDDLSVMGFAKKIEFYLGEEVDFVIYNNKKPDSKLIKRYAAEGEVPVVVDKNLPKKRFIGADLLSKKFAKRLENDLIKNRRLVRHNSDKIAKMIISLL